MAQPTEDRRDKVSLEDLLRFKKAERPDQAFWDRFDSELHQRMMQTLVKKDPWFVQVLRGLSGKLAQTTAIAAAAAVLALMVIRPVAVVSDSPERPALASAVAELTRLAEPASADFDPALIAEADYAIEVLTAATADFSDAIRSDYGLDRIHETSYDSAAYSSGMALSGMTSAGLASLVY